MAKRQQTEPEGSWLLAEELLGRGDPAFVDELRRLRDANRLGAFAARWYADRRPEAQRLLLEYLDRPLNAYRHESLVKRLFKLAEQAADDPVMAAFLVALDRSVRRLRRKKTRYDWQTQETWTEESIRVPGRTTLPRSDRKLALGLGDGQRLFSVHTRYYLRRRAWRYFRKLGKEHPARYVPAVAAALKRYTDADVADGLALIDNWGLMHALFHHSPAVAARANGWTLAEGHTLAELAPAPIFEPLWQAAPEPLLDLMREARCRPVRQWVIHVLRQHHPGALAQLPLPELLALLNHEDPEVAALAAEGLRNAPALAALSVEQWLALLEAPNPQVLDLLCELIAQHLQPDRIALEEALRLACSRPLPVARLGLAWLQSKRPSTPEACRALLTVAEAEARPVRPELVRWARGVLSASEHFQPEWVLEFLDSRHADVRAEGWTWLQEEARAREAVRLWQRLLESPYDDVRLRLVADLEKRVADGGPGPAEQAELAPDLVRFLWASVLLNIHRGSRVKPVVVGQLVRRLEQRPAEAPTLLPMLGAALRSIRGPEWRAGLAGVMRLVERNPELEPAVRGAFPELTWT